MNILILRTHHSFLERSTDGKRCRISAPTVWAGAPEYQPALKDVLSFIETRLPHLGSITLMISFGTYAQAYNVAQGRDNPDSYRMGRTCNSHKSGLYPYSKVRNHLMITYCNSFTKNDRMEFTTVRVSQRYPTGDTGAPSCPRRFATPRF